MLGEAAGEIDHHVMTVLLVNALTRCQTYDPAGACTPPDIVPRRNRREGTSVIMKVRRRFWTGGIRSTYTDPGSRFAPHHIFHLGGAFPRDQVDREHLHTSCLLAP